MRLIFSHRADARDASRCPPLAAEAGAGCLTGPLAPLDWGGFFRADAPRDDGFFGALVATTWRVVRASRVTPWMLGLSPARWWTSPASKLAARAPALARRWPVAMADVGAPLTDVALPDFTDDLFELCQVVAERLLDPDRMVKLEAQVESGGRDPRAALAHHVRHVVYDLHRTREPLRYNVYNNVRVALGLAWSRDRTLDAEGHAAPPWDERRRPRGRLVLGLRFSPRGAAPARTPGAEALEEALARHALVDARVRDLQASLPRDSAAAAEGLARALPTLLAGARCRGDVVLRAVTRWCAPNCARPEEVSLELAHALEAEDGDEPAASDALRVAFEAVRARAADVPRRSITADVMIAGWERDEVLPTVDALREALAARGVEIGRTAAGEMHRWFTRALRAAYAEAAARDE